MTKVLVFGKPIKKVVLAILILDIIGCLGFFINTIHGGSIRRDNDKLSELATEAAKGVASGYSAEAHAELTFYAHASADIITAAGVLSFLLVYVPRIFFLLAMRFRKTNFKLREIAFKVRLLTNGLHILFMIIGFVGLIILLFQSEKLVFYISIAGIVGYAICLVWIFAMDIRLSLVLKKYWEKSRNKVHNSPHIQMVNTSVISN